MEIDDDLVGALREAVRQVSMLNERVDVQESLVTVQQQTVARLDETVARVDEAVRHGERNTRRSNKLLAFDIALSVVLFVGGYFMHGNQDRINVIQAEQKQESDRNQSGLCATNSLFLSFAPKTLANPGYTPDEHANQQIAFATLQQIAASLKCSPK